MAATTDLALLTEALAEVGADISETMTRLVVTARSAVSSFIGLSVIIDRPDQLAITLPDPDPDADGRAVRASILMPMGTSTARIPPDGASIILYAASPGAFVDLAADLAWLTGQPPATFPLDQHLTIPGVTARPGSIGIASTINRAIGVLIGQGRTPEQAEAELTVQSPGVDRFGAALLVLSTLDARGDAANNDGSPPVDKH